MKAVDIKWDTEGDNELLKTLPKEMDIPEGLTDDGISDYLSEVTGFCHHGFELVKKLSDKEVEELWEALEDVLFVEAKDFYNNKEYEDDISLVLASDWKNWSAGTSIETIWSWFNNHHSKGLQYLIGCE